ncbi:MAG: hypothetical protein EBS36_03750 [Actinobacteria bacterium]|nr:hypothetical protein [Actinomycetota bacterium]NBY15669.1 hypothetical protein [Actinomycetota bacterium]
MPTLTTRFHVGAGTHVGPISVFPVWSENRTDEIYTTAAPNGLEIGELESASVETLLAKNASTTSVLIPEGTILHGGLQTRVLTSDVLLAPGQNDLLDVRCVEQGRWGSKVPTAFDGRAPITVVGALRGLRRGARTNFADQHDVWQRVNFYEKSYGTRRTSSLNSIRNLKSDDLLVINDEFESSKVQNNSLMANTLKKDLQKLSANPLPGQNGLIIGLSGQPVLLEIFSSEAAFREQLAGILDAVAIDAPHASGESTPARRAVRFADYIMDQPLAESAHVPNLLIGSSERIDMRSLVGASERNLLHTAVVNARHELILAA